MPYFTFTFREQVFQAQYELIAGSTATQYRVIDLPETLQPLVKHEIILQEIDGNTVKPGWDLGDVISDGLNQTLKGLHHL